MWMAPPKIMCRQHLIGEYRELFTFVAILQRKKRIAGYIKNDELEPLSLQNRYEELCIEMKNRGYRPAKQFNFDPSLLSYLSEEERNHKINKKAILELLFMRCPRCKKEK